jgi:hypothetical protein
MNATKTIHAANLKTQSLCGSASKSLAFSRPTVTCSKCRALLGHPMAGNLDIFWGSAAGLAAAAQAK